MGKLRLCFGLHHWDRQVVAHLDFGSRHPGRLEGPVAVMQSLSGSDQQGMFFRNTQFALRIPPESDVINGSMIRSVHGMVNAPVAPFMCKYFVANRDLGPV